MLNVRPNTAQSVQTRESVSIKLLLFTLFASWICGSDHVCSPAIRWRPAVQIWYSRSCNLYCERVIWHDRVLPNVLQCTGVSHFGPEAKLRFSEFHPNGAKLPQSFAARPASGPAQGRVQDQVPNPSNMVNIIPSPFVGPRYSAWSV